MENIYISGLTLIKEFLVLCQFTHPKEPPAVSSILENRDSQKEEDDKQKQ